MFKRMMAGLVLVALCAGCSSLQGLIGGDAAQLESGGVLKDVRELQDPRGTLFVHDSGWGVFAPLTMSDILEQSSELDGVGDLIGRFLEVDGSTLKLTPDDTDDKPAKPNKPKDKAAKPNWLKDLLKQ